LQPLQVCVLGSHVCVAPASPVAQSASVAQPVSQCSAAEQYVPAGQSEGCRHSTHIPVLVSQSLYDSFAQSALLEQLFAPPPVPVALDDPDALALLDVLAAPPEPPPPPSPNPPNVGKPHEATTTIEVAKSTAAKARKERNMARG